MHDIFFSSFFLLHRNNIPNAILFIWPMARMREFFFHNQNAYKCNITKTKKKGIQCYRRLLCGWWRWWSLGHNAVCVCPSSSSSRNTKCIKAHPFKTWHYHIVHLSELNHEQQQPTSYISQLNWTSASRLQIIFYFFYFFRNIALSK